MLVLRRRIGQEMSLKGVLLPTEEITIKVLSIKDGTVRVGIDAPTAINVVRDDALNRDPKQLELFEDLL